MTRPKRAHGAGSVYKRPGSPSWYLRWTDADGVRRSKPAHTAVKRDAEEMLRKELEAVDRGEPGAANDVTFEDMVRVYLNRQKVDGRRYDPTRQLKHLAAAFGGWKAKAITGAAVLQYEVDRLAAGASRATVNNELAALRRMFRLASGMAKGGVNLIPRDRVPAIGIKEPNNARQGFFEPDDFAAVLGELPAHLRGVMQFGYLTGWRVASEVITLQWRQVDFDAGTVSLPRGATKSGKARVFPFAADPTLRTLLEAQRDATKALEREQGRIIPWVFHRQGKQIIDYRAGWEAACRRAAGTGKGALRVVTRPALEERREVDPATGRTRVVRPLVHDLRRTAVRNLIRAGVSRDVAKRLTGHETDSIFSRYNITSTADLTDAVALLAAHREARTNPVPKNTSAQGGTGGHSGGVRELRRERPA